LFGEAAASQKRTEIKSKYGVKYGVWVEASSPGEPGPHLSLGVGDPNGEHYTFSFGHEGGSLFGGEGAVYLDTNAGGAINEFYPTTWMQSDSIMRSLAASIGTEGTYNLILNICEV
jgi:hypothetical protein